MKVKILISIVLCLIILTGCSTDNTPIQGPNDEINISNLEFVHSEKGWELYSWFDGKAWNYSILEGTNRFKSLDEVKENKIRVTGEEKLMVVLKKLPKDDTLTWIGPMWLAAWQTTYGNLNLPPQEIIDKIKQFCEKINLSLQVTD
jgi:hypothetical protein